MSFEERMREWHINVREKNGRLRNERHVELTVIVPLLNTLGYDTTDPDQVDPQQYQPETNKFIDFSLRKDNVVDDIIEAKGPNIRLKPVAAEVHEKYALDHPTAFRAWLANNRQIILYRIGANGLDREPYYTINLTKNRLNFADMEVLRQLRYNHDRVTGKQWIENFLKRFRVEQRRNGDDTDMAYAIAATYANHQQDHHTSDVVLLPSPEPQKETANTIHGTVDRDTMLSDLIDGLKFKGIKPEYDDQYQQILHTMSDEHLRIVWQPVQDARAAGLIVYRVRGGIVITGHHGKMFDVHVPNTKYTDHIRFHLQKRYTNKLPKFPIINDRFEDHKGARGGDKGGKVLSIYNASQLSDWNNLFTALMNLQ